MAIKTGSLGPLLQGVSQQPARVRLEGQVEEQINMLSDVTDGLSSRPATVSVGDLPGSMSGMKYRDIKFKGQDFIIGYHTNTLRIWDINASQMAVNISGQDAQYVGTNMRFHVVDDQIVMTNRDKVVEAVPATTAVPPNYAVFFLSGGEFAREYVVRVRFGSGPGILARYVTPEGNDAGDGLKSSSIAIAKALADIIQAHQNFIPGAVLQRYHDHVVIYHPTQTIRLDPGDGTGGNTLHTITDTVTDLTDLPKYAPNGMLVQVKASKATEDNYWLKFNAKNESVESGVTGFSNEGVWEESRYPYIQEAFNLRTMPHIITLFQNVWSVQPGEWLPRQVGDANSAPFPTILGKTIRDIGGFESRLVLLTSSTVVMSRTNHPFDLWRESATLISATDPIDMTSTKKNDLRLDWLIPFDRDMFIVADPGDSQFVIRGGGVDPTNASMVLTTEYEIESGGASPVSTGRTLLLPFTIGQFSGVNEFYTNSDNAAQAANSLTESVNKYITGKITHMAVSQNFNMAMVGTDSTVDDVYRGSLWVYKYLWDGPELLQSAWSRWKFRGSILHFFFRASRMYIVMLGTTGPTLEYLDLNSPVGPYGYPTSLDSYRERITTSGGGGLSRITSTISTLQFLQHTGCANPGSPIEPVDVSINSAGAYQYLFLPGNVPIGATLITGVPVVWELAPTEVFARDYQQRINTSVNLTIQEFTVSVINSGTMQADFISPYGEDYTYSQELYPLDGEPDYPGPPRLVNEDLVVPWGERSDWAKLRLWGNDYRPVTILEVQWAGQILTPRGTRA